MPALSFRVNLARGAPCRLRKNVELSLSSRVQVLLHEFRGPFLIADKITVLQLTFRQCKQYPRTLHSDAKFPAGVFTDPPPSPATTENRGGGGRWRDSVVFRSSPELTPGASRPSISTRCTGKMTREDTHLDTDVLWEADERHSDLARKRWTNMPSSFFSFFF